MSVRDVVAIAVLGVLVLVVGVAAALTPEEAQQAFQQAGCTGCHNGAVAPDFEGTIAKMREWAAKYGSLDEAVAAEAPGFKMFNNAKTWDELMKLMPGVTPELREFFENVFMEAKAGAEKPAEEKPSETTTPTATPTATETKPATPTPAETTPPKPAPTVTFKTLPKVPVPDPVAESEPLVRNSLAVGLGLYLAAVGLFLLAWTMTRKQS